METLQKFLGRFPAIPQAPNMNPSIQRSVLLLELISSSSVCSQSYD
jgi:hypothetical protein